MREREGALSLVVFATVLFSWSTLQRMLRLTRKAIRTFEWSFH